MRRRALRGGSATQARRSFHPPDSDLSREMEVLRGLQAEDDDFEDALEADEQQRREQEVQAAYATSCTLRAQRYTGAPIGSPSWQLPQARDGGDALPTSRERPL